MGIDYGSRRVGIALSDEGGVMAFPHSVEKNDEGLHKRLIDLAIKERVGAIVFGRSDTLVGGENPIMESARACADALGEHLALPIYFESEIFTTQESLRTQGRTPLTDASAATIILNSYLTRHKKPI